MVSKLLFSILVLASQISFAAPVCAELFDSKSANLKKFQERFAQNSIVTEIQTKTKELLENPMEVTFTGKESPHESLALLEYALLQLNDEDLSKMKSRAHIETSRFRFDVYSFKFTYKDQQVTLLTIHNLETKDFQLQEIRQGAKPKNLSNTFAQIYTGLAAALQNHAKGLAHNEMLDLVILTKNRQLRRTLENIGFLSVKMQASPRLWIAIHRSYPEAPH